jgi:uncharacterized protein YecT (DUF1311 family)
VESTASWPVVLLLVDSMRRTIPRLAVVVALMALPCSVRAETGKTDREACRASTDTSVIADCIEAGVYDPCDDAGGTWGRSQCAYAHSLVAERRIDRALKALRDRGAAELEPSALERLASSQRSFEAYRNEFCAFKGAADDDPYPFAGEMFGFCIQRMNQVRARELENMLRSGPTVPLVIPGTTPEERAQFLGGIAATDPRFRDYVELGLTSQDAEVRRVAAGRLPFDLWENIQILLHLIATDPDEGVRLSAALELHCIFTCNGAPHGSADVLVLERDLPLLRAAVTEPAAARYMAEVLAEVWCELTDKGRTEVTSMIGSVQPDDEGTESDRKVKQLLEGIDVQSCQSP